MTRTEAGKAATAGEFVFRYRARDAGGSRRSGRIAGRSEADAIAALRARGLFPSQVVVDGGAGPASGTISGRPLSLRQSSELIGRLAKLVGRRIALERALGILAEGQQDRIADTARTLRGELRAGMSFSEALDRSGTNLGPAAIALVRGAEASGDMAGALSAVAALLGARLALRRRIVTGLFYPSLLLVLAMLSVGLVLIAIIPQFKPLVSDRFDLIPPLGRAVFLLSDTLATIWPFLLVALLCAGVVAAWVARRTGTVRAFLSVADRLPALGAYLRRNRMTTILQVLGVLLTRDVPISHALDVLRTSVGPGSLGTRISQVRNDVSSGQPLSAAFVSAGLLSRAEVETIRIGEEAGELADMVSRTAADMREAADRDLERFLILFQPALIIFVGLVVGISLYALFSAIVSVNAITF